MTDTLIRIPTLTTARLTLRAPRLSDLDAYAAFRASDRARSVGGPFPRDTAFNALAALVGHWQLRGFGRWIVADRQTDAPLGLVGLFHPDDWPEPEIGWTVFDGAEGKGVAFEAAVATRDHAYKTLGWSRVISLISPENPRSLALAARIGATHEGDFAHPALGTLGIYRHADPETLT